MSHRDSGTSIDTQGKGRRSTQTGLQIANNTHNNMVLTKNGLVYYTLKNTQKTQKENKIESNSRTRKIKDLFRYYRRDNGEENRDRTSGHRGSNI